MVQLHEQNGTGASKSHKPVGGRSRLTLEVLNAISAGLTQEETFAALTKEGGIGMLKGVILTVMLKGTVPPGAFVDGAHILPWTIYQYPSGPNKDLFRAQMLADMRRNMSKDLLAEIARRWLIDPRMLITEGLLDPGFLYSDWDVVQAENAAYAKRVCSSISPIPAVPLLRPTPLVIPVATPVAPAVQAAQEDFSTHPDWPDLPFTREVTPEQSKLRRMHYQRVTELKCAYDHASKLVREEYKQNADEAKGEFSNSTLQLCIPTASECMLWIDGTPYLNLVTHTINVGVNVRCVTICSYNRINVTSKDIVPLLAYPHEGDGNWKMYQNDPFTVVYSRLLPLKQNVSVEYLVRWLDPSGRRTLWTRTFGFDGNSLIQLSDYRAT